MSYIDDLNQAASEALAASASATESSQIIYDVANGDENTTVTTANGEVKTLAKAIADITAELKNGVFSTTTEEVTLASGQTEVTLTSATTNGMQLYVEGVREFDFTITSETSFTLSEALPDGTRIWVVGVEFGEDASFSSVTADGTGSTKTLGEWVSGMRYNYSSLTSAKSDMDLREGMVVSTNAYREGELTGGWTYEVVPEGTGEDDGGEYIEVLAEGVQLQAVNPEGMDISHYGASSTDGAATKSSIESYAERFSRVVVSEGEWSVETLEVRSPIFFKEGSSLNIQAGESLTIRGKINSPSQHIFKGDGDVLLQSITDGNTIFGEDARMVHVSWFGAFPGDKLGDVGPNLQKLTDSFNNTRESHVTFDVGTYYIQTPVTWTRGTWVWGAGPRSTNIHATGSLATTGDIFGTQGVGCHFHRLQFGGDDRTAGAVIRFSHDRCQASDIHMGNAYTGIAMDADEGKAYQINGLSWNNAVGSSMVEISGRDCDVDEVFHASGGTGPDAAVLVKGGALGWNITNTRAYLAGACVKVESGASTASLGTIRGVTSRSGSKGVYITHSGSGNMRDIIIDGVRSEDASDNLIHIDLSGTGNIEDVVINNLAGRVFNDTALLITNSSTGIIDRLSIGSHAFHNCTNFGVYVAGTGSTHGAISISSGVVNQCDQGYAMKANPFSVNSVVNNAASYGYHVYGGSGFFRIDGVAKNSGSKILDESGSVTKTINIP